MSTITQDVPPLSDDEKQAEQDAHRDPLSGRAGAHPVGTGIGAASGGIAAGVISGMAVGTVAGPLGTVAGAAIGAAVGIVGGGLAGKEVAEHLNPTFEHGFWREHFITITYNKAGLAYEDYAPAYQYGWESRVEHSDESFDKAEPTLRSHWDKFKGASILSWEHAKDAVRDAWNRAAKP